MQKQTVTIFTDGASKGNPGPGGWGAVISIGNEEVIELGGADRLTTNNEMELTALVRSLEYLDGYEPSVKVYLDSKYVLNGVMKWMPNWKQNNWQTATKKPVKNKALWQRLDTVLEKYAPILEHIPGHSGIAGNERADGIASGFAEGKEPRLYAGSQPDYPVDLSDLSTTGTGSQEKKKRSRAKAYSYVSRVDGIVRTHETWAECEARVKGAKGARYKKALSKAEEDELIREFNKM